MSASMTANDWWMLFSNWAMVLSTFDSRPVCLLFFILTMHVCALVLMDGGVLALYVIDVVLCAGSVVLIVGLCLFFLMLCLATVDFFYPQNYWCGYC